MILFLLVLLAALAFEYVNGFHDAANAIATVISTRVLTARQAIIMAAIFNLVGASMGTAVASTIGKGLVDTHFVSMTTLLAALVSAILWGLFTWWLGLPSSSSHALIGGLCGAAFASAGNHLSVLKWNVPNAAKHTADGLWPKVVLPMVSSPLIGFAVGMLLMSLILVAFFWITPNAAGRVFGKLQLLSAAAMAFSHGSNDAQKTMGLITLALVTGTQSGAFAHLPAALGFLRIPEFRDVPTWVIYTCALTMAAGHGGRRLPDHPHDGPQGRAAPTRARVCGGNVGGAGDPFCQRAGHPGFHDARHQRVDHGRGRDEAAERGEMGRRWAYPLGLGVDAAGDGGGRVAGVPPPVKITLDIDALLADGRINADEYARLKSFASETTSSLALNLVLAFGIICVAGGTVALVPAPATAIALGLVLAAAGGFLGAAGARWTLLANILLPLGALMGSAGLIAETEGSAGGFALVAGLLIAGAVAARSGLLASLSVFALLAALGGATGYEHASYFLEVTRPFLTVVVFAALMALGYGVARVVPPVFARIADIFARTAFVVVNLGFWIGSLWGDRHAFDTDSDVGFIIGWALCIVGTGAWGARTNNRWLVNTAATFGAIHLYTQWFEHLGATPGSIILAGLFLIAAAYALITYNRRAAK